MKRYDKKKRKSQNSKDRLSKVTKNRYLPWSEIEILTLRDCTIIDVESPLNVIVACAR